MLKVFESLMSLLDAAANEVVHDAGHFTFFVISRINEAKTAFYESDIKDGESQKKTGD